MPPLAEQHRILARFDALMGLLDRLEAANTTRDTLRCAARDAALNALRNAPDAEAVEATWSLLSHQMDALFTTPEDIAPLRQTILQLAVRGRLSSPLPNDSSAQATVQRAKVDRSWRFPEREKSTKKDPSIEAMVGKRTLPDGWLECRVDDVAQLINGRAYAQPELLEAGTPVIRIQNLNGGTRWYYSDLTLPDRQYCSPGDLLFAWSASFGPYIWQGARSIYHYHIWKIQPSPAIASKFLYYVLGDLTEEVRRQSHGLAMLHMTKARMEDWPVLVPPIEEQHRIVAKVDALMALCDQLEARLQATQALQSQLAAAAVHHLDL